TSTTRRRSCRQARAVGCEEQPAGRRHGRPSLIWGTEIVNVYAVGRVFRKDRCPRAGSPEQGVGRGSRRTTRTLGGIGAAVGGRAGLPRRTRPLRAWRHRCRPGHCAHGWLAWLSAPEWGGSGSSPRRPTPLCPRRRNLALDSQSVLELEDLAARDVSRRQPQAPPALPPRVQLPIRSPRTRERTLLLRPAPSRPWRASPLRSTDG